MLHSNELGDMQPWRSSEARSSTNCLLRTHYQDL
ncbi:hypothetical protein SOVF_004360 [Spinacia oleracea]|nr:hypothetical protein SOVF_004360 [Spinacia oleracea]